MSALWAGEADQSEAPLGTATARQVGSRPVLRGLPQLPPRLARVPFIGVLIALFALGMTGLLMLNTTLQNQAFQVSTLHRQASELAYSQSGLESQLDQLAAPQELARRASAAGLRANPYPAFLVLPKGRIVGHPQRVTGAEAPTLIVKTPEQLAAERVRAAARQEALAERAAEAQVKAKRARDHQAEQDRVKAARDQAAARAGTKPPGATTPAAKSRTGPQQPAAVSTPQPSAGRG